MDGVGCYFSLFKNFEFAFLNADLFHNVRYLLDVDVARVGNLLFCVYKKLVYALLLLKLGLQVLNDLFCV
jgi:hypothetical protein